MNYLARMFLLLAIAAAMFGCSDSRAARPLEFKKNIYTGHRMQPAEWLAKDVLENRIFTRYGGLDMLVTDCTAEAGRNQGLDGVRVLGVKERGAVILVDTEISFKNGKKLKSTEAWMQEDGVWKLTFRSEGK